MWRRGQENSAEGDTNPNQEAEMKKVITNHEEVGKEDRRRITEEGRWRNYRPKCGGEAKEWRRKKKMKES